jgi:hypothetical protein
MRLWGKWCEKWFLTPFPLILFEGGYDAIAMARCAVGGSN